MVLVREEDGLCRGTGCPGAGGVAAAAAPAAGAAASLVAGYSGLSSAQRANLLSIARDTWKFYSVDVDPATHLPLDNVTFAGGSAAPTGYGRYTSAANIGVYLWAVVAARPRGLRGAYGSRRVHWRSKLTASSRPAVSMTWSARTYRPAIARWHNDIWTPENQAWRIYDLPGAGLDWLRGAARWRVDHQRRTRRQTGRPMTAAAEHPCAAAIPQRPVTSQLPVTPVSVPPVVT
jgi:hypothetical protein